MKKFVAAVAVLAPVMAFAPTSPANADSVCAPITIDGQPVCQDLTPIEQAITNAEVELLQALSPVLTVGNSASVALDCIRGAFDPTVSRITVDVVTGKGDGELVCSGTAISVDMPLASPGPTEHVHVPQICVTVTNTCAGPVDQDVTFPLGLGSSVSACETPETVSWNGTRWVREYTGPSTCVSVPV
ncbi:MAG: hypothetical protein QOC82_2046 [Frankiaceae bacterium]|nr:hypothetical protein [Frankiaceae bacterium]